MRPINRAGQRDTCTVRSQPVAMITDLWCHLTYNSRGAGQTVYAMLLSNLKRDAT